MKKFKVGKECGKKDWGCHQYNGCVLEPSSYVPKPPLHPTCDCSLENEDYEIRTIFKNEPIYRPLLDPGGSIEKEDYIIEIRGNGIHKKFLITAGVPNMKVDLLLRGVYGKEIK